MRFARDGAWIACAIALVFVTGPARAEGENEFYLQGGLSRPDDALTGGGDNNNAVLFGLRYGHTIGERVGWFLDATAQQPDSSIVPDGYDMLSVRGGADIFLTPITTRARVFFGIAGGYNRYDLAGLEFGRPIASLSLGQRVQVGPGSRFRWEVRVDHSLNRDGPIDEGFLDAALLVGFGWGREPRLRDLDGDGVRDRLDACPGTPRGARVDVNGCPMDSDGDGVFDGIDRCPTTPPGHPVDDEGCTTDSDRDGVSDGDDACPDTPVGAVVSVSGCPVDSDGDGVPDGLDQCPATPAGALVDEVGCPWDTDADGVYDGIDRCADTPRGVAVDAFGCKLDSDGDGVADGDDRCPDTPAGTAVDENGCPRLGVESRGAFVLRGVRFELNSATLTADSYATLDLVVQTLTAYPEARIEVGGHTDTQGSAAYNQRLSEARARSVRDYLVAQGIAPERLEVRGYGEDDPIATGTTEQDHARNRRVELKRIR